MINNIFLLTVLSYGSHFYTELYPTIFIFLDSNTRIISLPQIHLRNTQSQAQAHTHARIKNALYKMENHVAYGHRIIVFTLTAHTFNALPRNFP